MASEQDCLDALHEAAATLGHSPSKAEYEELGLRPASATIIRTLGGWNDAKARAGLSTNASTGSRVGPPPDDVDSEIRDRWSALSVDQRWHYRHQAWNTERTRQRRSERREWVAARKAATGCEQCGETDTDVLDYHHPDSTDKTQEIGQMIKNGASKDRLREEMDDCVVLCANCHRAYHTEEFDQLPEIELHRESERLIERENDGSPKLSPRQRKRKWTRSYKQRRGCTECCHRKARTLDFHHVHPQTKTKSIGRLISDGCTVKQLLREIDRCEIICANCHRKRHAGENDGENTSVLNRRGRQSSKHS